MPRFQLEVAVALTVGAVSSAGFFYLSRSKEGKITLPTEVNSEDEIVRDPFDVTTPEDVLEGYPIDEETFWTKASSLLFFMKILYSTYCRRTDAVKKVGSFVSFCRCYCNRSDWHWMVRCERGHRQLRHFCSTSRIFTLPSSVILCLHQSTLNPRSFKVNLTHIGLILFSYNTHGRDCHLSADSASYRLLHGFVFGPQCPLVYEFGFLFLGLCGCDHNTARTQISLPSRANIPQKDGFSD